MTTPSTPISGPGPAAITIQFVGGPTAAVEIGGVRLLTDPTFEPGDHPVGNRNLIKTGSPAIMADAIGDVDAVLLSHGQHPDNLDNEGRRLIERVPLVLTTAAAANRLGGTARELPAWRSHAVPRPAGGELKIIPAQHGPAGTEHLTGEVRGFVLSGEGLPTVYISGDNASLAIRCRSGRRDPWFTRRDSHACRRVEAPHGGCGRRYAVRAGESSLEIQDPDPCWRDGNSRHGLASKCRHPRQALLRAEVPLG